MVSTFPIPTLPAPMALRSPATRCGDRWGIVPRTVGRVRTRIGMAEGTEERDERWRAWMTAAQGGDGAAYAKLLEELLPFVRGIVRARLRDDAAHEDVAQEVLLSIHTARHTYRPERALVPWVRAIARNAVIDQVRRHQRREGRHTALEPDLLQEEPRPAVDAPLSRGLERALATLPGAQRQAVTLLKVKGLSVAEAAEQAGVSQGALKLRAHRGYKALRDLLGRELE